MTEDLEKVKEMLEFRNCSIRTVDNYLSSITRFKNYCNDNGKNVKSLNEADILKYLDDSFIKKNCKPATLNLNRSAIRYYYIINFQKVFNNDLLPSCKIEKRYPIVISTEQAEHLINEETSLRNKIWWCLGFGSGLRVSEVASLKVCDISHKQHKIRVVGKGNKERFVPLPEITYKLLYLYYQRHEHKIKNGFLFPSEINSSHINYNTINAHLKNISKQIGLDSSFTFHNLRHSFATEFIRKGGDMWELKSILGHSTINITMMYLHMAQDFSKVISPLDGMK